MKYESPNFSKSAFTCPHCGVYAQQKVKVTTIDLNNTTYSDLNSNAIRRTICINCDKPCLWYYEDMIYPARGGAPPPNPDMPGDARQDYEEAARVFAQSPRGAAALLRLAVQRLCVDLGGSGKNINDDIKKLVSEGLPDRVRISLDVVRVTGNNAVHPGQIVTDDPEVAASLFPLLNVIVEYMISILNQLSSLYDNLPEGAKNAIVKRDEGSTPTA